MMGMPGVTGEGPARRGPGARGPEVLLGVAISNLLPEILASQGSDGKSSAKINIRPNVDPGRDNERPKEADATDPRTLNPERRRRRGATTSFNSHGRSHVEQQLPVSFRKPRRGARHLPRPECPVTTAPALFGHLTRTARRDPEHLRRITNSLAVGYTSDARVPPQNSIPEMGDRQRLRSQRILRMPSYKGPPQGQGQDVLPEDPTFLQVWESEPVVAPAPPALRSQLHLRPLASSQGPVLTSSLNSIPRNSPVLASALVGVSPCRR